MSKIKLYVFKYEIHLTRTNGGVENFNMPLNRSDFVAYKGVHTNIDFVVRDYDRKPITLVGKKLSFTALDSEDKTLVLKKGLKILDPHKGKAQLILEPNDLADVIPRFFRYVILLETEYGTQEILYTDQNQQIRGFFELRDGAIPLPQLTIEIKTDPFSNLTPISHGDPPITRYVAQSYEGCARTGNTSGLHTIGIYLENFYGKFWVQGALTAEPPSDDNEWFNIELDNLGPYIIFNGDCGIVSYNFTGNLQWVRFMIEPDSSIPKNGKLLKILYKN